MRFTLFFFLLAIYFVQGIKTLSWLDFIYTWLALNFTILGTAYLFNKPEFIIKKNQDGNFSRLLLISNFPWLSLTWVIFRVQIFFSKEDALNHIAGTSIWISRKLKEEEYLEKFDLVVDLTAEFFKDNQTSNYYCLPNLDGIGLKNYKKFEIRNKKILVHCANGHGRSSTYLSLLLMDSEVTKNINESIELILKSRKMAKPNKVQMDWLKKITANFQRTGEVEMSMKLG